MSKINNDEEIYRGMVEDRVRGYAPLSLDEQQGLANAAMDDYEVDEPMGDILMAEYVDESSTGEVYRGGLWLKEDIGTKMWRTARVVKVGPFCPKNIQPGVCIRFPSDKGIKAVVMGKKYVFLNADRIFCTVKPVKPVMA